MSIPLHISELNVVGEGDYMAAIEEMAEHALADRCTATNPRKPTKEEISEIYKEIW